MFTNRLLLFLFTWYCVEIVYANRSATPGRYARRTNIVQRFFQKAISHEKTHCRWLKGLKFQNNLCLRQDGLPETLYSTKELIVDSCRREFMFEHWNCENATKFFKKMYRETAFMYSLVASGLYYSIARACATNDSKLVSCGCGVHKRLHINAKKKWGGCSDNMKYAKSLTNKFLQVKKSNVLAKYNMRVGMKTVQDSLKVKCKCAGLSGSCSLEICFKQLQPFEKIVQKLRDRYHSAIISSASNSITDGRIGIYTSQLLYSEPTPSFCLDSGKIRGRRCSNVETCATLCCTRGFVVREEKVKRRCNEKFNSTIIDVTYNQCEVDEKFYACR